MTKREIYADVLSARGFDLSRNYFELSSSELAALDLLRRAFRYQGNNRSGRSRLRQFWYAAQHGASQKA